MIGNEAENLDELFDFLRIPSVSADQDHVADVNDAAYWVSEFVQREGGSADVLVTSRHPLVVGRFEANDPNSDKPPTVLLYGHVDVQPPGNLSDWHSDPFEPVTRGEWLYARGASDDKGNLYMLLKAVANLNAAKRLPVNVKLVCDAEEEIVGNSVLSYLRESTDPVDACVIFDAQMESRGQPIFVTGTRGLAFFHVTLRTGQRNLHSGVFGGATLNAGEALVDMLAGAKERMRTVLRANSSSASETEPSEWRTLQEGADLLAENGARPSDATAAAEFYERTLTRTALVVTGVHAGEADLQENVLPVEARANLQLRLSPADDAATLCRQLEEALRSSAPEGADITISELARAPASIIAADAPAIQIAADAFKRVVGARPLLLRSGGTLPILGELTKLGIPSIVTGFDLPEGNIHSANERLLLSYLPLGISAAEATIVGLGDLPASQGGER